MAAKKTRNASLPRKSGQKLLETVPEAWVERLRLLPGYDPLASRENCTFDLPAALHALGFIQECLKHVKGAKGGQPFVLEAWQIAIIANIFGWKRADGSRRYREVFLFVARKNGKSPLAAAIVLYMLFCEQEQGMELYSAAADAEQAGIVFSHAKGMVLQEPELTKRCQVYETAHSIVLHNTMSAYRVISSGPRTKHGLNSNLIVIDELHALPDRELVDILLTSTGARRQPLILYCTTSDYERPSICNEKYDYASKVRDGVIADVSFLPVIYEAPKELAGEKLDVASPEYFSRPAMWKAANPNLGVSVSEEYLERAALRAQNTPGFLNTFLRLHLNIKTQNDVAWLNMQAWDSCYDPELVYADLAGHVCYGGLDLASTNDLCALVLVFPDDSNAVLPVFWIPQQAARQRQDRQRVPYLQWAQQSMLRLTEGDVADYAVIERDILQLAEQFDLRQIAYDRWGAAPLVRRLQDENVDVLPMGQGFASLSAPSKELERLVISKDLRHDANAVLRWCVSNTMVESDAAGNIKPSKKKSAEKIDGTVSLVMAIGLVNVRDRMPQSVYETRGFVSV